MTVSGPASYLAELKFGSYDREFRLAELEARGDEPKFSHTMNLVLAVRRFRLQIRASQPADRLVREKGRCRWWSPPLFVCVTPKTASEAGENGLREPEASARAFLRVIDREPDPVERALTA